MLLLVMCHPASAGSHGLRGKLPEVHRKP